MNTVQQISAKDIRRGTILMLTLFLLNIADFTLTKSLIDVAGYAVEVNPIQRYFLMTTDNVYSILLFKMITLLALVCTYFYIVEKHKEKVSLHRKFEWMLRGVNFIYVIVVVWGIYLLNHIGIT